MRTRAALAALFLLSAAALAQDKKVDPKPGDDDPIAAQLLKDKEAYVAAAEKAKGDVLKSFDKLYESVKANKSLKIGAQIELLEKIEEEKKAFEEAGTPPTVVGLKAAMDGYRAALKKADAACRAGFEKAAKAYRDRGDVKTAALTLDEMTEFLAGTTSATAPPLMIRCGNSGLVVGLKGGKTDEGTQVVTVEYEKGDQTMLWKKVPAEDGWCTIENVKTGLVMTAKGKENGSIIAILKKESPPSEAQLWKLTRVPVVKDAVKIVPKLVPGKPLDIYYKSKDPGTRIVVWDDANENHRYFGFFPPK